MDLGLKDKVVIVTGGSGGIGSATAIAFGAEGARVAVTFRDNQDGAEATVAAVRAAGGDGVAIPLDLADPASIAAGLATLEAHWGALDVLVNNAVAWPAPAGFPPDFATVPSAQWRDTLRTNLEGSIELTQAALTPLRKSDAGRIVCVSSGAVEYGMPGDEVYAAAKSGLQGFMRCLAREMGPEGVLVNIVMPGLTETDRTLRYVPDGVRQMVAQQTPSQHLSTPKDVAAAVVFLGSAANGNITGEIVRVSGGN